MKKIEIVRNGNNWMVVNEEGYVRHFFGTEEEFVAFLLRRDLLPSPHSEEEARA